MRMRISFSSAVMSLGLVLAMCPQPGRAQSDGDLAPSDRDAAQSDRDAAQSDREIAQSDRDFVFTDLVGHLVLRFAGTAATGLDESQRDEVVDSEFSRMVHDRLRADLMFEAEPVDPEWAAAMEPQIQAHVEHAGLEFSDIAVECRADSCRVLMQQPGHWTVPEHQAVLDTVQTSFDAFIAAHRQEFEPVFLLAAYDKEAQTPNIKAFLRRAGH